MVGCRVDSGFSSFAFFSDGILNADHLHGTAGSFRDGIGSIGGILDHERSFDCRKGLRSVVIDGVLRIPPRRGKACLLDVLGRC